MEGWRIRTRLALLAIIVLLPLIADGQNAAKKSSATGKKDTPPSGPKFAQTAFDPSADAVSKGYLGHSIKAVIARTPKPKGEFETTEDYVARRKAAIIPGVYAFLLPSRVSYDADNEQFTIGLFTAPTLYEFSAERPGFVIDVDVKSVRHYPAKNAFGTEVVIKSVLTHVYLVQPRSSDPLVDELRVDADRQTAPKMKDRLKVGLAVVLDSGSLLYPLSNDITSGDVRSATGFDSSKATISNPEETYTYQFAVAGHVIGLFAFDSTTGKIVQRFAQNGTRLQDFESIPLTDEEVGDILLTLSNGNLTQDEITSRLGEPTIRSKFNSMGQIHEEWQFGPQRIFVRFDHTGKMTKADRMPE